MYISATQSHSKTFIEDCVWHLCYDRNLMEFMRNACFVVIVDTWCSSKKSRTGKGCTTWPNPIMSALSMRYTLTSHLTSPNVDVKYVGGRDPEMLFMNDKGEVVKVRLSDKTRFSM